MNRAQTRVWKLKGASARLQDFRTAVSLHSHTCHSKEKADFIPFYTQRIPVLSRLVASSVRSYEARLGIGVDFHRVYWTPPVFPRAVLASERWQIEQKLGLAAMVSITDHNTIAAALSLRQEADAATIPISVEWSVPFAGDTFHIGVHNLPPARAGEIMNELVRYTAEPDEDTLNDLLASLDHSPETLLVLNHPYFDLLRLGSAKHHASLQQFLSRCRSWIHALELSGLRPWREGQETLRMADEHDLPIVAGGDRHGRHPNGVLNLTHAESWGEYVACIREKRQNDILLLPVCEEPVRFQLLQIAAEVSRDYPLYPDGYRQFADRIFVDLEGCSWHRLSFYWGEWMPLWLRPLLGGLAALGSYPVRPVLRRSLSLFGDSDLAPWPANADYQGDAVSFQKDAV